MKSLFLAAIAAATLPASAKLIDINFDAQLTSMFYADCQALSNQGNCTSWANTQLSGSNFFNGELVSIGQTLSGHYVYDTESPISGFSNDGTQAVHLNAVPLIGVNVGNIDLPSQQLSQAGIGSYSVVDNRGNYDSFFIQGFFSQGDWFVSSTLDFQDPTGKVFNGFAVPETLQLGAFTNNNYQLSFLRRSDGDQLHVFGKLTSVQFAQAVPEPETFTLAIFGILFLYRQRRRT
ncbi:MAG: hypothetical protein ACK4F8_14905 [Aquabacterium sp.]